jgi:hypothetical protein
MLHIDRGCLREALEEFRAAGRLQPQLASSLAMGRQMTGWTQARLGLAGERGPRSRRWLTTAPARSRSVTPTP